LHIIKKQSIIFHTSKAVALSLDGWVASLVEIRDNVCGVPDGDVIRRAVANVSIEVVYHYCCEIALIEMRRKTNEITKIIP
jgi:hypothetical protein